ncbi:hypothetical protein RSO01_33010 [Reyranella soli]|uniref:Bacterial type II secretion system protein E domain-containing protein n=1 Tax=Reyranella soli TaxID=1230389 RepID=A0A512NB23_9HYPH|nr:hypothetical protein RSO01_33010 [Reyranella soli]
MRGAEAMDLLKAWGTGHPGGVGTLHAGSALAALRRLEQLIQKAIVTVPRALIAETVEIIAVLAGRGAARRLSFETTSSRTICCAPLAGVAHARPSNSWTRSAVRMVDLLLNGLQAKPKVRAGAQRPPKRPRERLS